MYCSLIVGDKANCTYRIILCVTQHENTWLISPHFWISELNNFLCKHRIVTQFLSFIQLSIDFVNLIY